MKDPADSVSASSAELAAPEPPRAAVEPLPSAAQVLISRVTWFVQLRWLAVAGVFATILVARHALGLPVPGGPLYVLACLLFASNTCFHYWARRLDRIEDDALRLRKARVFANVQIGSDLVLLTLLLHFSGGVENPFSLFFVFHMVLASILLSAKDSYCQAMLALALFMTMALVGYVWPGAHVHLKGLLPGEVCRNGLYVFAHVAALGVTLFIAVFLTSSIAHRLRAREAELREAHARTERLVWSLADRNRRLQEIEERQSKFMRVVAHQLRSPLAAIDSCLKLVLDGYLKDDRERELDMVLRARTRADAMLELIGELLDLARHRDLVREEAKEPPANLDAVVESVVRLQAPVAQEKHIELTLDAKLGAVRVPLSAEKAQDAVGNLVSNAVKYTPAGGRVAVRTWREGDDAWFEVKDTGIGIPKEEQEHLFTEFFRASNAKAIEAQGTGLGLAIALEIVKQYGGDIEYESQVGAGTTFRFHVPIVDVGGGNEQ